MTKADNSVAINTATTLTTCLTALANDSRLWVKIQYDIKFFHSVACLSVFTQLNRQFGEDWARLTRDLLFKPHL